MKKEITSLAIKPIVVTLITHAESEDAEISAKEILASLGDDAHACHIEGMQVEFTNAAQYKEAWQLLWDTILPTSLRRYSLVQYTSATKPEAYSIMALDFKWEIKKNSEDKITFKHLAGGTTIIFFVKWLDAENLRVEYHSPDNNKTGLWFRSH